MLTLHFSTTTPRSCLYGDGLFETIAFRQGQLQYWSDHWQRLQEGLLRLHYPLIEEHALLDALQQALSQAIEDLVIRLSISRSGQRGYRIPSDTKLFIEVQTSPFPTQRWDGKEIRAIWCQIRWAKQPLLAGIKHLNRLEQVLARSEWQDPDIEEGIVCDTDGYVISGTMSGLVWRKDHQVFAPALSQTGIDSTSRKRCLTSFQEQGYSLHIGYFTPEFMMQADEILLMNAIQGMASVKMIEM